MRTIFLFLGLFLSLFAAQTAVANNPNALYPIIQHKKVGFADKDGHLKIPCAYDWVSSFEGDLAKVQLNGKYGYINPKGEVVIPIIYDEIELKPNDPKDPKSVQTYIPASKNQRWGIITREGKELVPFEYDDAGEFGKNGLFYLELKGKMKILDKTGKTLLDFKYTSVAFIPQYPDYWEVELGGKYGIIDTKKNNKVVLPLSFDYIDYMEDGLIIVEKSGLYGGIDLQQNELIPFLYKEIEGFEHGFAAAQSKDTEKWGFIDTKGKTVIPFEYEEVGKYDNPSLILAQKNKKYGFIDAKGKTIVPFEYDDLGVFGGSEVYIEAKKKNRWGTIDRKGNIGVPCQYDELDIIWDDLYVSVRKGKFWGCVDNVGKEILPFEYEEFDYLYMEEGFAVLKKNGKFGVQSIDNKNLIPFEYDEIDYFWSGISPAKKNGKYGLIDLNGKAIIPFRYDDMSRFSHGLADATLNKIDGYVDRWGNDSFGNTPFLAK